MEEIKNFFNISDNVIKEALNSEENIKADNLIKISEENTSAAKAVTDNEIIDIPDVEELEI